MAEERNFLARWSQRKLQKKHEDEDAPAEPVPPAEDESAAEAAAEPAEPEAAERHPAEDIDIDALTKESDFTVFMQKGVPQEVKRRALRKLWTSDPVLANLDGLNDYEDMERVYGMGPIGDTAWKLGRGFLTDEELGLGAEEEDGTTPPDGPDAAPPDEEPLATEVAAETAGAHAEGEQEAPAPDDTEAPPPEDGRERG